MGGREERDRKRNWAFEASKSTFSDTPPIRLPLVIPTKELSIQIYNSVRAILIQTIPRPEDYLCSSDLLSQLVFDSLLSSCSLESFWIQQIVLTGHLLFWKHFCNVLYLLYVKIPEVFLAL